MLLPKGHCSVEAVCSENWPLNSMMCSHVRWVPIYFGAGHCGCGSGELDPVQNAFSAQDVVND